MHYDNICPICGFESVPKAAANCFANCLKKQGDDGVYEVELYVCPICLEEFEDEEDAQMCHLECFVSQKIEGEILCSTCQNQDLQRKRYYPCPNRNGEAVSECQSYEPDVRTFGCAIETEHRHRIMLGGG